MTSRVPGPMGTGPRAPRRPGRWPRNWAALYDTGTPAARVLRADWDGVMPITGPSPAAAQIRAASASTRVFPDSGRRVEHRDEPAVGQRGERGGGLVLAQPAARARVLRVARVVRASGQRVLEPRRVRAERVRGFARGSGAARRSRSPARPCALP